MIISLEQLANELKKNDCFSILTHQYPDGDTLGSAYALCLALQKMGKKARVLCSDPIQDKYSFLKSAVVETEFLEECIVAVDVADPKLLGEKLSSYEGKIDLCIDHHASGKDYAKVSFVNPEAAATAEIVYEIIKLLDVKIDSDIANCIYTGISTDTGCFKYSNVTAKTHQIAADLITLGAKFFEINKAMFDTKSKKRIELEKLVMNSLDFFFDDKCAVILLSNEMIKTAAANEDDLEGFAGIPRRIEGVLVGVTFREKETGVYKISVRTNNDIDASSICKAFGGGGHKAAAGCTIDGGFSNAKNRILAEIKKEIDRISL